jgi:RNA polymerase sigma-70 factor, ECF subfamily
VQPFANFYQLGLMAIDDVNWDHFVRDIGTSLFRYFSAQFASQIASDLVQETLIRLVQKHRDGSFQSNSGTLKSYAFGIARRVRLEGIKAVSKEDLYGDHEDFERPLAEKAKALGSFEYEALQKSRAFAVRHAINRLKPIEQEVILLMIDQELSLEQIAGVLEMPVGTVKSHVHRAKENLKIQMMESQYGV